MSPARRDVLSSPTLCHPCTRTEKWSSTRHVARNALHVSAEEFIATLTPHEGSLLRVRATSAVSAIVESPDRDHVESDQEIQP